MDVSRGCRRNTYAGVGGCSTCCGSIETGLVSNTLDEELGVIAVEEEFGTLQRLFVSDLSLKTALQTDVLLGSIP